MSKRKRKEMAISEPSTQLSITKFMLPKIKLELAEKKIKLEFEKENSN